MLILAGLLAIPLLWFVPPWIGSGDRSWLPPTPPYNGHLGPTGCAR